MALPADDISGQLDSFRRKIAAIDAEGHPTVDLTDLKSKLAAMDATMATDRARREITKEITAEMREAVSAGETGTPALWARSCRSFLQSGTELGLMAAVQQRELLHRWAAQGSEHATDVLELLAADPFWSEGELGR